MARVALLLTVFACLNSVETSAEEVCIEDGCVATQMPDEVSAVQVKLARSAKESATMSASTGAEAAATGGCGAVGVIAGALQGLLTAPLQGVLKAYDPLDMKLVNKSASIDIDACELKINADADLKVTGLNTLSIKQFGCLESKCLERGLFHICTKTRYTFAVKSLTGPVRVSGAGRFTFACNEKLPESKANIAWTFQYLGLDMQVDIDASVRGAPSISGVSQVNPTIGEIEDGSCGAFGNSIVHCGDVIKVLGDSAIDYLPPIIDKVVAKRVEDAIGKIR